jgi:hypothetical protein
MRRRIIALVASILVVIVVASAIYMRPISATEVRIVGFIILMVGVLAALVFVFIGEYVIDRLSVVRRFQETHNAWTQLLVSGAKIPSPCRLDALLNQRFEEIGEALLTSALFESVRHRRFGQVVHAATDHPRLFGLRDFLKWSLTLLIGGQKRSLASFDCLVGRVGRDNMSLLCDICEIDRKILCSLRYWPC